MRPSPLNRIRRCDVDLPHATNGFRRERAACKPYRPAKTWRSRVSTTAQVADHREYHFADERQGPQQAGSQQRNVNYWIKRAALEADYPHKIQLIGFGTRWRRICSKRAPPRERCSIS